jgi:hypothetical protein
LKISDTWIKEIGNWIDKDGSKVSMAHLWKALNPGFNKKSWSTSPSQRGGKVIWSDGTKSMNALDKWNMLHPEDQEWLQNPENKVSNLDIISQHWGGDTSSQNLWRVGGLYVHQGEKKREGDFSTLDSEKQKEWSDLIEKEFSKSLSSFKKKTQLNTLEEDFLNTYEDAVKSSVTDFFLHNHGDPNYGISGKSSYRIKKMQEMIWDSVKNQMAKGAAGSIHKTTDASGKEDDWLPDSEEGGYFHGDDEGMSKTATGQTKGGAGQKTIFGKGAFGQSAIASARHSHKDVAAEKALADNFTKIDKIYQFLMNQYLQNKQNELKAQGADDKTITQNAVNYADKNLLAAVKKNIPLFPDIKSLTSDYHTLKKQQQAGADVLTTTDKKDIQDRVAELEDLATKGQTYISKMGYNIDLDTLKDRTPQEKETVLNLILKHFSDEGIPSNVIAQYWPQIKTQVALESVLNLNRKLRLLEDTHLILSEGEELSLEHIGKVRRLAKYLMENHPIPSKKRFASVLIEEIEKFLEMSVVMGTGTSKKEKDNIKKTIGKQANVWGAPGAGWVSTPKEDPIKKSLKEYLENKKIDQYKERLSERLKNG